MNKVAISKELCSLKYATVDQVVRRILQLGESSYLAKIDIQHAFRNIPINPEDCIYLGMCWCLDLYIDTVLPFGLREAPKLFNAIADAVEWILLHTGVTNLMRCLDDFLTIGSPRSRECRENLQAITVTCKKTRSSIKRKKSRRSSYVVDLPWYPARHTQHGDAPTRCQAKGVAGPSFSMVH